MKLIKFRGKNLTGETFYGDLNHLELRNYTGFLNLPSSIHKIITINGEEVNPDTVAQLAEVKDGVEYYEGDETVTGGQRLRCRLVAIWEEVTS